MKKISIFLLPVLFFACSQPEEPKQQTVSIKQWEVIGKDTCNRLDSKGRKQGVWYVFDNQKLHVKDTLYYKDGEITSPPK